MLQRGAMSWWRRAPPAAGRIAMHNELEILKARAEATYNAAADSFDAGPTGFWARYGKRTVERLGLRRGQLVLDVGCGTGNTALPAAARIGPRGRVVAVDLAERMLAEGRRKAAALDIANIVFCRADMTALDFPERHFDAVISAFSFFLVPDLERHLAELWRLVRPGGQLAITTWGANLFEPCATAFWQSVERLQPGPERGFKPWAGVDYGLILRNLLLQADLPAAEIEDEAGSQELVAPEDWWTIVLGSSLRSVVDRMSPPEAEALRRANVDWVAGKRIQAIETNVTYARLRKAKAAKPPTLKP